MRRTFEEATSSAKGDFDLDPPQRSSKIKRPICVTSVRPRHQHGEVPRDGGLGLLIIVAAGLGMAALGILYMVMK